MKDTVRSSALRRLSIIKGQIGGLEKMIDDDKYCVDVLTQLASIQNALRGVGKVIVEQHLKTCVVDAVQKNDYDQHIDELMDIMYTLNK